MEKRERDVANYFNGKRTPLVEGMVKLQERMLYTKTYLLNVN